MPLTGVAVDPVSTLAPDPVATLAPDPVATLAPDPVATLAPDPVATLALDPTEAAPGPLAKTWRKRSSAVCPTNSTTRRPVFPGTAMTI